MDDRSLLGWKVETYLVQHVLVLFQIFSKLKAYVFFLIVQIFQTMITLLNLANRSLRQCQMSEENSHLFLGFSEVALKDFNLHEELLANTILHFGLTFFQLLV